MTLEKILLLICAFTGPMVFAQEPHNRGEEHRVEKLSDLFTHGEIEGHIRNYFMNTRNQGELKDYYTNALGGAIAFKTLPYKGLEAGVKGIFTYRTFSADLNEPDEITGGVSKWEHELYDATDFENFNDLDRLEELYLKYNFRQGYFTYGKMEIRDTPLLNESDGRMKPFAFKGVWLHLENRIHRFEVSWIDRVSPRSTVEWYDFNEALGLAFNGYQPNGVPAHYYEKTESKGIALMEYYYRAKGWRLRYNHYYLHRMFNIGMANVEYNLPGWRFGVQYALQVPDGFQEELPYEERYMQPDETGQVISILSEFRRSGWLFNAAYSRAFSTGRFLFPRELGRDHFYTSVQRSRLEGFGNSHVYTLQGGYNFNTRELFLLTQFTGVHGPEVGDLRYNKYNLDSYHLLNTKLIWNLSDFFEGLRLELFYVRRWNMHNDDPQVVFNLSNFDQFNLIINYYF
ncbi:hypothetical protein E7Z59_07625 [Robertkochia marina]|uniref:Outer membrane porin, OprD family n=1 Tax=Robertkochia marina TaxID=1227945 RepID=A0A4S3M0K8_9FLAO|nr:hypothetical protein [Robertkochia marina]THD67523.1 hypothetical protein E7Z59_07625 [Robertkochia marina]TRZ44610.1 hypothetical protein D3A96_08325 [Robertkochia marina]